VGGHPLRSPTRRRLGRPLPYQLADGPQAPPKAASLRKPLEHGFKTRAPHAVLAVLSDCYSPLPGRSPTCYAPIRHSAQSCDRTAFDLHVLSTPPAFILSQDQTLRMNCFRHFDLAVSCPEIVRCERLAFTPNTLIGRPTHRLAVQASLTTGVASYHSSVVKVQRAALQAGSGARAEADSTTSPSPSSRETKNRCKAPAFASALRGPLYLLACLVLPMPAGLNVEQAIL
jgi:hypothetical protein